MVTQEDDGVQSDKMDTVQRRWGATLDIQGPGGESGDDSPKATNTFLFVSWYTNYSPALHVTYGPTQSLCTL